MWAKKVFLYSTVLFTRPKWLQLSSYLLLMLYGSLLINKWNDELNCRQYLIFFVLYHFFCSTWQRSVCTVSKLPPKLYKVFHLLRVHNNRFQEKRVFSLYFSLSLSSEPTFVLIINWQWKKKIYRIFPCVIQKSLFYSRVIIERTANFHQ